MLGRTHHLYCKSGFQERKDVFKKDEENKKRKTKVKGKKGTVRKFREKELCQAR